MANEFVAKNGLISQNNTTVSGSLTVTQGITGSLQGTASWANNALNIQGGTTDYIPLWATNTSLANSYLNQSSNILKTIYSTTDIGLKLDFGNNQYILGDPGSSIKILVNTATDYAGILDNGSAGIKLEGGGTRVVTIGDAWGNAGTNTKIIVDATNNTTQISGSVSINADLRIQGSYNQGLSNINFVGNSHVEGNSNYAGLRGYAFTGASGGVITFQVGSDISAEIGDYVVIDDLSITKAYKVVSSVYDPNGVDPVLIITLEDTTFSGSGKVASILTRQLTGGTEIIGYGYGHAEGNATTVTGDGAHAAGAGTVAVGQSSFAGGGFTIANSSYQTVIGQHNQLTNGQGSFVIGNGTSNANRSNLLYAQGSRVQITGSLNVSAGITGSLQGLATSASFAQTASFALNAGSGGSSTGGISQGKVVAIASGYSNLF